jgi:ribosome biogenesis GTPase
MDVSAQAADACVGRVLRTDRGLSSVLTEGGLVRAGLGGRLLARVAHQPDDAPCTGDWVLLRHWPDHRVTLEEVLPRRTALVRATAGEQSHGQVLCANHDLAAVVVALHPEPVLARVERLLTLAWESGATPVVLLTKADLVGDAPQVAEDVAAAAPGVRVICTSTRTDEGLSEIRALVEGTRTMALLGASGHGKSSLANALAGADLLGTRQIRADGRGRHTSVRRELVPLPGGGAVIDTPGLRGIGLVRAEGGLEHAFADIDGLAAGCRFGDCRHEQEPGCAVLAAVEQGSLPLRRLESWRRLHREMSWSAKRAEQRERAARRRRARGTGS